jgi:N-acetylneuraminic acid mutarotase
MKSRAMRAFATSAALVLVLVGATGQGVLGSSRTATGSTAAVIPSLAGTWRPLSSAPIAPSGDLTSVWARDRMLVFARRRITVRDVRGNPYAVRSVDVAAAYTPATDRWRRLAPLKGPTGSYEGRYTSVWTGREMLVFGPFDFQSFDPRTNRWRRLPAEHGGGAGGLDAWTGHELIDWGGGCCGDASASGDAYDPTTRRWRTLAPSPLAPSQRPIGAWTGRELIVLVSGLDPDGKPYPSRLARAAAYEPATDSWRRIARPPVPGGTAVWDRRELLVVGGGANGRSALAYAPTANRWRRLAPLPSRRFQVAILWAGTRLLLWGGSSTAGAAPPVMSPHGLAYDPRANRWSTLPRAPLAGRLEPSAVWTGRSMVVWGGTRPEKPFGTGTEFLNDGAAFAPTPR